MQSDPGASTVEDKAQSASMSPDIFDPVSRALAPVANDLARLNTSILSFIPVESDTSLKITQHVFGSGGKRIRPGLFYMSARLAGYSGKDLDPMAAVAEFVHTASLLHDDVVDNSSVRRNKPTANSIWGDESSVLVGDLIYARASEMMAATGSLEIVSRYARAIRLMSEGELLQLEALHNPDLSEAAYFRIVECKTATLIATACRSAGILAGLGERQCDGLEQFGRQVGLAFQLLDDALDYAGADPQFGKSHGKDLAEGKVTLPLILLRTSLPAAEWAKVAAIIRAESRTEAEINWVTSLVQEHGALDEVMAQAHAATEAAAAALAPFPQSESRDHMCDLGARLAARLH